MQPERVGDRKLLIASIGLLLLWLIVGNWRTVTATLYRNSGFLQYNEAMSSTTVDDAPALQAIQSLQLALRLGSREQSALRALGYLHLATNDESAAVEAWEADTSMVLAVELMAKGQAAENAGSLDEALGWYELATKVAPQSPATWLALGLFHENGSGAPAAMAAYAEGLSVNSTSATGSGDLRYRLANLQSRQAGWEDWASTLALVTQAIEDDDFDHDWSRLQSHFLRGDVLIRLGRLPEARIDFEWVLQNRPDDYFALLRLGQLVWQLDGDATTAEAHFRAAAELDPAGKWAYHRLAQLFVELGQPNLADAYYAKILELDPADSIADEWLSRQN